MSIKDDGKQNTQSAKVLQLGFNISVSGDPDTDFQIVLDDSGQKAVPSITQKETSISSSSILPKIHSKTETSKTGLLVDSQKVESEEKISVKLKNFEDTSSKISQKFESSSSKESNIISEIKSTIEHFEKFSDHLKDVPRLKGHPPATSTPLSDKNNSKSESNLIHPDYRPRRFPHLNDYYYKKNYYFNKPGKPPDLFLKPLPGENLYRSGFYTRYKTDSLRHYVSDSSINKTSDYKSACERSRCDDLTLATPGILKKPDGDIGDKQSTSSAESIKDIKIYQSGGILIMQNFKENLDCFQKKEISSFSAELIENCNRLKDEVNSFQERNVKETGISSEEGKSSGKVVQFDLPGFENQKPKSKESSFNASKDEKFLLKQGSSDSISSSTKNKDSSPQGTSQSQDFPSLSTVENESTISNQFGVSPTYSSTKKLEWDSGADVGYHNSDLSKENLSTIEKYVLSHLSSGTYSDNIANVQPDFSKFAQVRIASDKLMDDIRDERKKEQQEIIIIEKKGSYQREIEVVDLLSDSPVKNTKTNISKGNKYSEMENEVTLSKEPRLKGKPIDSIEKSVNVNTLFENFNPSPQNVTHEDYCKVDISNKKLSKVRKFKRSKPSPRKITWAPQKRRFSLESVNKNYELCAFEMDNPKKTYKKVVKNPVIGNVELSQEVEEIVIDQRFKIKQNVSSNKEIIKPSAAPNEKDNKFKRPVSGSSSSNNTVLPNPENKEMEKKQASGVNKFSDQISQTVELDRESVAVQAFESQKSSDCSFRARNEQEKALEKVDNVHLSSKNIQAFGFHASLPKELAHPKGSNFPESQYTKSTQFFGGPITSLPNYHSRLITKPEESKVLNTKKVTEAEIIRLNEENKKNILANDFQKINSRSSNAKNKENLYSKNSKKSHSSASQKTKDASSIEKKDVEGSDSKLKRRSSLLEDPDCFYKVSSKVLTSEMLKEHGDSIDRNIIQEKYFQSQLIELKKKEMISKSTSINSLIEGGRAEKECVTVGCQYSSHSKDTTSEEESKNQVPEEDFMEKSKNKSERTETTDQYDFSENIIKEDLICTPKSTNQGQITNDSLPSSTQTAHSWIPGRRNREKDKSVVGRARSFEYLPGHIYESSGNLREELSSETEQNSLTSSSSESELGKQSINEGGKDSEGRNTLILENSTENSHESNQLKILDENLTQLNLIVSKLWEKDAAVKNLNESLFLNLCHKNGSGDYIGNTDILQPEVLQKKNCIEYDKESSDTTYELSSHILKKAKEISTGCQTEEKSSSDAEKFYHKRKILEKRISEEKQNQIKWIENEIHHLNILRGLLEKQNVSQHRKKRYSLATETFSGFSETKNGHSNCNLNENYSEPVTPVYGCTVSLARDSPAADNRPTSERSNSQGQPEHFTAPDSDPVLYGMSVSLKNIAIDALKNVQHVVKLPVGVQISLKSSGSGGERSDSEEENKRIEKRNQKSHIILTEENGMPEKNITRGHVKTAGRAVCTQYPSSRRDSLNLPSTSVQTDFSSGKCSQCRRQKCFCLRLSDRSLPSASRTSRMPERRGSLKCSFKDEELVTGNKTSSSTDAELLDVENSPNLKSHKPEKVSVKSDSKSGSSESYPKIKCMHKNECNKRLERSLNKSGVQGVVCRNLHQSNPTSISEKSSDFSSCHCSKVHIEKFSTCSCHIIKITKATCSAEGKTHECKKRTLKTTENQSCQTDQVTIVTKDLVANPELVKVSRAQNIDCISEGKIAVEKKNTMCQKLSNDPRISLEKRRPYDKKLEVQKKVGVVKRSPEVDLRLQEKTLHPLQLNCSRRKEIQKREVKIDEKTLQADQTCTCFEAFQREIAKDNDIEALKEESFDENYAFEDSGETLTGKDDNCPRHYFLKIEETEIDDSTESLEMKNSLEVITVKIPVKKAGKGKIYDPKCNKSYRNNQKSMSTEAPKGCNCCQACRGYKQKALHYNTSEECREIPAEKPQSPEKFSVSHSTPVTSSDDMRYQYKYDKYQPYDKICSSSGVEGYCDKLTNSYDSAPKRNIQMEYDSHKKYRCNATSNFYKGERYQGKSEKLLRKPCYDVDEIQLNDQEKSCRGVHSSTNNDYYNYDKIEYKTKSELLKEEEKNRKTHQLSLQEYLCKNRPDFYNTAEKRRQIITEKARERTVKHNNRIECLMSMLRCCNESNHQGGEKRIFTTSEMRGQTMKQYKKLPEVTGKVADQRKKEEYRTNRLVADIYSKKLQIEALKGHLNLSNSTSVLATI